MMIRLLLNVLAAHDPAEGASFDFEGEPVTAPHVYHAARPDLIEVPDHWPGQFDLVQWCSHMGPGLAAVLVVSGVIYLLFGYKIFKTLVVLNAAVVGAVVGVMLGEKLGPVIPLAIVGGVLAAAVTWPTMKYAVAVMGAVFGAVLGATVWHGVGLEPRFAWSGAAIGLVGGGLLCFILFRGCVVLYTSLQGAVMLILGVLALLLKYQDVSPHVGHYLALKPFLLPMCIFIPAVAGMMYQQHTPMGPKPPAPPPKK